jgi:hypothetical protein
MLSDHRGQDSMLFGIPRPRAAMLPDPLLHFVFASKLFVVNGNQAICSIKFEMGR